MKRYILLLTISGCIIYSTPISGQAESELVNLNASSDYIFWGVTKNDGFVAQPSLEVSHHGITLRTWVNFDLESVTSKTGKKR